MTPLFPSGAWLSPVLAAGEWDVLLNVADLGTSAALGAFVLKAWWTGSIRRAGEVEEASKRAEDAVALRDRDVLAAENRTAVERARADRQEEARERIQAAVLSDLAPQVQRVAAATEQLSKEIAGNAELMERLIRAVVRLIERQP